MRKNNQQNKVRDSIVAFIDILGSSMAINDNAQKSLEIVHSAYAEALEIFDDIFDNKLIKPQIKIFSDNTVVAVPQTESTGQVAFLAVAMMSAIIQVQFLKHSFLTRGAICSGSFFCDDMMVWGTALVKAYKYESTVALYPRVIIEPELIGKLGLASKNCKSRSKEWIIQDEDRMFMVDYFHKALRERELFILQLTQVAEDNIVTHNKDVKACQKWLWFNNYIIKRLTTLSDDKDDN